MVQQLIFVSLLSASHCMQMQHRPVKVNQLPFINSTSHYFSFSIRFPRIITNMTYTQAESVCLSFFWTWMLNLFFKVHLHCIYTYSLPTYKGYFLLFYGLVQPKRESFMNNKALLLFRSWYLCQNQQRIGKSHALRLSVEKLIHWMSSSIRCKANSTFQVQLPCCHGNGL